MLAYTGMPLCSKGVRFRRSCPLPICPYLWRIAARPTDGPTDTTSDHRRASHWRRLATRPTLATDTTNTNDTADTGGGWPPYQ